MKKNCSENILAVGSDLGHSYAELLALSSHKWSTEENYPFSPRISVAPIIFTRNVFLMFGGFSGGDSKVIAQESFQVYT